MSQREREDSKETGLLNTTESVHTWSGCGHMAPSLTQKLFPINNHLQIKLEFTSKEFPYRHKLLLRVVCIPSSRWPTHLKKQQKKNKKKQTKQNTKKKKKKKLNVIFGGSLTHNIILWPFLSIFFLWSLFFLILYLFILFYLSLFSYPTSPLCIYYGFQFCIFMRFLTISKWVSVSISVSCAFS